jgi:hypothetical protein
MLPPPPVASQPTVLASTWLAVSLTVPMRLPPPVAGSIGTSVRTVVANVVGWAVGSAVVAMPLALVTSVTAVGRAADGLAVGCGPASEGSGETGAESPMAEREVGLAGVVEGPPRAEPAPAAMVDAPRGVDVELLGEVGAELTDADDVRVEVGVDEVAVDAAAVGDVAVGRVDPTGLVPRCPAAGSVDRGAAEARCEFRASATIRPMMAAATATASRRSIRRQGVASGARVPWAQPRQSPKAFTPFAKMRSPRRIREPLIPPQAAHTAR